MNQPEIKCTQTFRLPIPLAEKLRALAKEDRRALSEVAVMLLESGIKQWERDHAAT